MNFKSVGVILLAVLVVIGGWFVVSQRGLVSKHEEVVESWSAVEVQYQRRADLIPALIDTIKGYTNYEENTLKEIVEARNSMNSAKSPQDFENANNQINSALSGLNVVVERYPDLKANESFNNLMLELSGTENRVANARDNYNSSVKRYSKSIKMFPTNIIAGMLGFEDEFEYIKAVEGADKMLSVKF